MKDVDLYHDNQEFVLISRFKDIKTELELRIIDLNEQLSINFHLKKENKALRKTAKDFQARYNALLTSNGKNDTD